MIQLFIYMVITYSSTPKKHSLTTLIWAIIHGRTGFLMALSKRLWRLLLAGTASVWCPFDMHWWG